MDTKLKETHDAKAIKIFLYEELAQKGKPFIDFKAKTINGEDFLFSSCKGNYIYLNFWSAGCGFCRMENKYLRQHFNEISKDFTVINFSVDKNKKSME